MAQTNISVLLNLIADVVGTNKIKALNTEITKINGTTKAAKQVFKDVAGNIEKTTSVTAGFNNQGKAVTKVVQSQKDISSQLSREQEKVALAHQKAALASQHFRTTTATINSLMEKTGLTANELKRNMSILGYSINSAGKTVNAFGQEVKLTDKEIKAISKGVKRFNMNMLSLLFASMALKRAMTTLFRSMLVSYDKANGEQSAFRKETNKVIAAWEFFKYSIIDALAQSQMFQTLVNWLFIIINAINEYLAKNPNVKTWIGLAIIFAIIAASVMLFLAQLGLAANGLSVLAGFFKGLWKIAKFVWDGIAGMARFTWMLITKAAAAMGVSVVAIILGIILIIGGIILIVSGVIDIFRFWGKDWGQVAIGIVKVIAGIGLAIIGVMVIMGTIPIIWAVVIAAIIALVALAVVWIIKNWDKVKIFFIKLVNYLVQLWVKWSVMLTNVWRTVVNFIINLWVTANKKLIDLVVYLINLIIKGIFSLPRAFITVFSKIIDIAFDFAKGLLSVLEFIPGMEGLINRGFTKIKGVAKGALNAIGDGLSAAENAATGAVTAVGEFGKSIYDNMGNTATGLVNKLADGAIAGYNAMGQAVQKWADNSVDSIKKVQTEQEAANKAAAEPSEVTAGTTEKKGLLGGVMDKFMPNNPLSQFTGAGATGTQVNDNSTKIDNMNIEVNSNSSDPDEVANLVMEKFNSQLNQSVGSTTI